MNRQQRRAERVELKERAKELPNKLTILPRNEWPHDMPLGHVLPDKVWVSKHYLVQQYNESIEFYPGLIRLTICRTTRNKIGRWRDGLSWDELQYVKNECGYGDWYGMEIYPRDCDLVNDANMRHLWLLPEPLHIGWFWEER